MSLASWNLLFVLSRVRVPIFALAIAVLAVPATPGYAAGKHGGGSGSTTPHGTCSVAPNPVGVYQPYTVSGSGYTANELLELWIKNSAGTQVLFPPVDGSGTFAISSLSDYTGPTTVIVYDHTTRSLVRLTSCAFQVV
jgi:hypothetical protein